jgi:hypothetical protein
MPAPSTPSDQQKTPAGTSRGERTAQPLKVAQIFALKGVQAFPTGDAAVVVHIGDPTCAPHTHGIRASRNVWTDVIAGLFRADPVLAERVRARAA